MTPAEIEWRRKRLEEEDEFEDLTDEAKTLQEQELEKVRGHNSTPSDMCGLVLVPETGNQTCDVCVNQIKSNLGRLILKEEKDKAVHFRRKTQSLPDRTHMHTSKILLLVLFCPTWILVSRGGFFLFFCF